MKLLEDMAPGEMLAELRKLDVEFRERQRAQTLLAGRMAFINTMLKGKFRGEVLHAHCQNGDGYCDGVVEWRVHYSGYDDFGDSTTVLVCEGHKPKYGGMGVSIQKFGGVSA